MRRRGGQEWATVVLLPLVWVAGVVLLWRSHAWTTRDKLIGTLLIPGGLAYPIYVIVDLWLMVRNDCPEPDVCSWAIETTSAFILLATMVVPPLAALYLALRADRTRHA